jgi:O-antigen/teichoic acid export membrane protein
VSRTIEGSGARVVRNTVANGAGRLSNAAVAIVLTPFLLRNLGAEQYGVWLLATALTFSSGFLRLADLGIQQATVRLIAEARRRRDFATVRVVGSTTTALYACLGIVLAIVVVIIAGPLVEIFKISEGLAADARVVFVLVGIQVVFDLPAVGLLAVIEGSQRYGALRLIDSGSRLAWAVSTVILVTLGHGVVALAAVSLVFAIVSFVAAWVVAAWIERSMPVRLRSVSPSSVKHVLFESRSTFALRVIGVLYAQIDRVVIGVALAAAAVASYEVAFKIQATAAITLGIAPSAVLPAAAFLGAGRDHAKLRELFVRGTKYALALALPICVAGIVYAKAIIVTWVGDEYADMADATRLFLLYPAVAITFVVGQSMLIGLDRMGSLLKLHVIAVLLNVILSIVLVGRLGIEGVIWGTLGAYLVVCVPFTRLFLREFDVTAREWARRVMLPIVPVIVVQAMAAVATLSWVEGLDQLWMVGIAFAANCALAGAIFFWLSCGREERAAILRTSRRGTAIAD